MLQRCAEHQNHHTSNEMSRMKTEEWCMQLRGDGELQDVIGGTQEKIHELDQKVCGGVNEDIGMEKKQVHDDSDVTFDSSREPS